MKFVSANKIQITNNCKVFPVNILEHENISGNEYEIIDSLLRKHLMKGNGLVQCYFLWTVQHYYKQVLAFTKKLGLFL